MEFTVAKPTHDPVNKYYQLLINSPPVFTCDGADLSGIVFTGATADRLDLFIDRFLGNASSYFSKPLDKNLFLERLAHKYSTGDYEATAALIQQVSWIPVRILFYPARYEIHWLLTGVEAAVVPSPGTQIQEADIDELSPTDPPRRMLSSESAQKRTRQKIRQARIRCGFAKLHLEHMIEKYYRRYGNFDGLSDADSELSSEEEP
jgi:hypothetical protein